MALPPQERALLLGAVRPLLLGAFLLSLEPIPVAAVFLAESLLIGLILAVVVPYMPAKYTPEEVHTDLDGFSARWPANPAPKEEMASAVGFVGGFLALPGIALTLLVGLWSMPHLSAEPWLLILVSCTFAVPAAIAQFVATALLRGAASVLRRQGTVTVEQSGRVLVVNEVRWTRSPTDTLQRQEDALCLCRGEARLTIPGGPLCLDWLEAHLRETQPPAEDAAEAAIPASLQALRARD